MVVGEALVEIYESKISGARRCYLCRLLEQP